MKKLLILVSLIEIKNIKMKHFTIALFLMFNTLVFGQTFLYNAEGVEFDSKGRTINDIIKLDFPEVKLHSTEIIDSPSEDLISIIYQTFNYKPLFILSDIDSSRIEEIKEILFDFKNKFSASYFIDHEPMIKNQIKNAIEVGTSDIFVLKTLGKPSTSYERGGGYKSFTYDGYNRRLDLIFSNGVLSNYSLFTY